MISSLLSPDQNLQGILSSLSRILTPTEKLPGNSPIAALLAQPHMVAPQQYGQQQAAGSSVSPLGSMHAGGGGSAPAQADSSSGGSSPLQSILTNPKVLQKGYSALSGMLGNGLSAYGSGAAADAAVASTLAPTIASELGTTAASVQAANDAALASQLASEGVTPIASSSAAAPAASQAATGLGAGAGAATALGLAALPLALAAFVPTGENASWWQGLTNQINNPATAAMGKSTLANDLMNNPGDNPYSSQQLQAWGIPQIMQQISQPITKPTPGGWLGGSARGMSRI